MAGRGPAPKKERTRRNQPARGEWTTLPAEKYKGPKPNLPRVSGGLLQSTKKAWEAWWSAPMAHMWNEADWPTLLQTIVLLDRVTRALHSGEFPNGFASMQTELRQLRDGLGLTEKGRRDLRWQLPTEDLADEPHLASVTSLPSRARPDPRPPKKKPTKKK